MFENDLLHITYYYSIVSFNFQFLERLRRFALETGTDFHARFSCNEICAGYDAGHEFGSFRETMSPLDFFALVSWVVRVVVASTASIPVICSSRSMLHGGMLNACSMTDKIRCLFEEVSPYADIRQTSIRLLFCSVGVVHGICRPISPS